MSEALDLDAIEKMCDAFAGAVLLPSEILLQEFGKNRTAISMPELRRIKELYGISIAAIMVRAGQGLWPIQRNRRTSKVLANAIPLFERKENRI
jgi:Zn-dependent peptidase ImmA (M78 family)